jgi:hypothetical protein|tara:strand:- start:936 stop:1145 length:210 start_codon:yes stop_codon:yes gene_type:complete
MADCKFCGTYVVDDSSAGMDSNYKIYHPKCEILAVDNYIARIKHFEGRSPEMAYTSALDLIKLLKERTI